VQYGRYEQSLSHTRTSARANNWLITMQYVNKKLAFSKICDNVGAQHRQTQTTRRQTWKH